MSLFNILFNECIIKILLPTFFQLYETVKADNPDALKKIVPIAGDITLAELGISEEDQKVLADEVSVVFHSAATVKFDEKLKLSINVNVQGTKRIVELCKRMTHLVVSKPNSILLYPCYLL